MPPCPAAGQPAGAVAAVSPLLSPTTRRSTTTPPLPPRPSESGASRRYVSAGPPLVPLPTTPAADATTIPTSLRLSPSLCHGCPN